MLWRHRFGEPKCFRCQRTLHLRRFTNTKLKSRHLHIYCNECGRMCICPSFSDHHPASSGFSFDNDTSKRIVQWKQYRINRLDCNRRNSTVHLRVEQQHDGARSTKHSRRKLHCNCYGCQWMYSHHDRNDYPTIRLDLKLHASECGVFR